jgi:uncharacterized RDD family membrane protein YckC
VPEEAQRYQGRPAGIATRAVANTIDFVVVLLLLTAVYHAVSAAKFLWSPRGFEFPSPSLLLCLWLGGTLACVFFAGSWATTGRTYGDHVLGLRVVDRSRHRLHWGLATVRAIGCVVFPIGLLWVVVDRRNRSVQDLLLRTRVVYDWTDALR